MMVWCGDDGRRQTERGKGWTAEKSVARAHAHVIYGGPTDGKNARHYIHVWNVMGERSCFLGSVPA